MTVFVSDTLFDTNGTRLEDHIGLTGATWTIAPGQNTGLFCGSTGCNESAANSLVKIYYASGSPSSADYSTQATFVYSSAGDANELAGVLVRVDTSVTNKYYWARYNRDHWEVYVFAPGIGGGSGFVLLGTHSATYTNGATHTIKLTATGSSITFAVDSTTIITATDSNVTAAGKAGIGFWSPSGFGHTLNTLTAFSGSTLFAGTASVSVSGTTATVQTTVATGGTSPYNYQFQRAPDSSGSPGTFANVGSNTTATSFNDTGLSTTAIYWYQCVVTDSASNTVTTNHVRIPRTFYLDSSSGSDSNLGTSAGAAWQTLSHASSFSFVPQDSILLTSGETFLGTLTISNSGSFGLPIIITTTSTGTATINTTTAANDGILLLDCGYVTVSNITLIGPGVSSSGTHTSSGVGMHIKQTATAPGGTFYNNITIDSLSIQDYLWPIWEQNTTGTAPVGAAGGSGHAIGYNETKITNCTIHNGGRKGIYFSDPNTFVGGAYAANTYFKKNIYVNNNTVSNVYGDTTISNTESGSGILFAGVQDGLAQWNVVSNCGAKGGVSLGGPVGMYMFACSRVVYQFNEVHNQASVNSLDGGGFDIDGSCDSCILQCNYSHDNVGAGYEVGEFGSSPTSNSIVRYNITQNDALLQQAAFHFFGSPTTTYFYNNVVFMDKNNYSGTPTSILSDATVSAVFYNNVFYLLNGATLSVASNLTGSTFAGNCYWMPGQNSGNFGFTWNGTTYSTLAAFQSGVGQEVLNGNTIGINVDPGYPNAPGSTGITKLKAYDPSKTSPLVDTGLNLRDAFGLTLPIIDLHSMPVPANQGFDIGAVEFPLNGYTTTLARIFGG